jgi:SAM-dependent methyltransferase
MRRNWDLLGERDPLWAILSEKDKKGARWDLDAFFRSGVEEIDAVLARLRAAGADPARGRALDFGCGAGRLAQALAAHFASVDGVDVSAAMVELARKHNRHGERVRYHLNGAPDLALFADGVFDFAYTSITLQHVEPVFALGYVRELLRVLSPRGVLVFQLPSRPVPDPAARGLRRLKYALRARFPGAPLRAAYALRRLLRFRLLGRPVMEMHFVPREEVLALLAACGARVVEVAPDGSAGRAWESFRYVAAKGGGPGPAVPSRSVP